MGRFINSKFKRGESLGIELSRRRRLTQVVYAVLFVVSMGF